MTDFLNERPCLNEEELKDYLGNSLPKAKAWEVENHLLDCPFCAEAIEGFQAMESPLNTKEINKDSPKEKTIVSMWGPFAAAACLVMMMFFFQKESNKVDTQTVFAEHFTPMEYIDPTVRGGSDPLTDTLLQEALEWYQAEKYEMALVNFLFVLEKNPKEETALFFAGICDLKAGRAEEGLKLFNRLLANEEAMYFQDAYWYKSLCYLSLSDHANAKITLKEIIAYNGFYKKKAEGILQEL